MRAMGWLFGIKFTIAGLVIMSFLPLGIAYGAAQTSPDDVRLDPSEHYVTQSEVIERNDETAQAKLADRIVPESFDSLSEPDPGMAQFSADLTNRLIRVSFSVFNAGAAWGYANRHWVSPAWVSNLTMASMALALLGIAGAGIRDVRRRAAS